MKLPRSLGEYRKLSGRTQVSYAAEAGINIGNWKMRECGNVISTELAASLKADLIDRRDLIDDMIAELQGAIDRQA